MNQKYAIFDEHKTLLSKTHCYTHENKWRFVKWASGSLFVGRQNEATKDQRTKLLKFYERSSTDGMACVFYPHLNAHTLKDFLKQIVSQVELDTFSYRNTQTAG